MTEPMAPEQRCPKACDLRMGERDVSGRSGRNRNSPAQTLSPASRHMLGSSAALGFLGQEVISKVNDEV